MYFSEDDSELRKQILTYNATVNMSDAERANFLGLPKSTRIREGSKILFQENLTIGEHCWIGENSILDASGFLEIGDYVQIGLGVYIWTHNSFRSSLKGVDTRKSKIPRKKTIIGNNCFIAGPSVIMPGITIGNKCIIPPMSIVDRDIPDNTIFSNSEIKLLKEEIYSLRKEIENLKKKSL